jgi:hypothetical protein
MIPEDPMVLLARIDERTKAIQDDMMEFVTREEFLPVQRIVYGIVALALSAVGAAVLAAVL